MNIEQRTYLVKTIARELGFDFCGIAKAQKLEEDARRLENWLNKGMQGTMHYMENHFDLRIDPTKLVPGARTVITLLLNYYPPKVQNDQSPKISKYAYGNDYHSVIKKKLNRFLKLLKGQVGEVNGRGFVDSAPVLERTWGQRAGMGWIGKNGNLINKHSGSFFFIATLVTDLELEIDTPFMKDFCGTCDRCIRECPTNAILPDKVIDGSKCISYFTIELKDMLIPGSMKDKFDNWMFGCDVCQDVCPWNRFAKPHREKELIPIPQILDFSKNDWEELTEESFKAIFKESALKRSKYEGIRRNLKFISQ